MPVPEPIPITDEGDEGVTALRSYKVTPVSAAALQADLRRAGIEPCG